MSVTLLQSPFAILGASICDGRGKLNELVEEKELLPEVNLCRQARTILTHPKMRLRAELGWFLGVSPQMAVILLDFVKTKDIYNLSENGLPPIVAVNVLMSKIELMERPYQFEILADAILKLAVNFDAIVVADVFREINEERAISGFSSVQSTGQVTAELDLIKKDYFKIISGIILGLERGGATDLIILLSEMAKNFSSEANSAFLDDIFSAYDLSLSQFYEEVGAKINSAVTNVIECKKDVIESRRTLIDELERLLRDWFIVVNPIQARLASRGIDHQQSSNIGFSCRSLYVDLFNNVNDEKSSAQVQALILKYFKDVPDVFELANSDMEDIESIKARRLASIIRCERCQTLSPHLRVTVFYRVWSFLFTSEMLQTAGLFCEQCRSTLAWKNATFSMILGPWGLPWGVIHTLRSLYIAVIGGDMPRDQNAKLLRSQGYAFLENGMIDEAFTNFKKSLEYDKLARIFPEAAHATAHDGVDANDAVNEALAGDIFKKAKVVPEKMFLKGQAIAFCYGVALIILALVFTVSINRPSTHLDTSSSRQIAQSSDSDNATQFNQDWETLKPEMQACKVGKDEAPATYTACASYLSKLRSLKKVYSGANLDLLRLSEDAGSIWLVEADHAQGQKLDDVAIYKAALNDIQELSIKSSSEDVRRYAADAYGCFAKNNCPTPEPNSSR